MAELAITRLIKKNRRTRRIAATAAVWSCAIVAALTTASAGWACPNCPLGRAARQQVCDDGLAQNLAIALVPFLLVGLVSAWAERIGKA